MCSVAHSIAAHSGVGGNGSKEVSSVPVKSDRGADAHAATTLHGAALFLAHTTPDAGILTGLKRPLEAFTSHRTTTAHGFGLLYL